MDVQKSSIVYCLVFYLYYCNISWSAIPCNIGAILKKFITCKSQSLHHKIFYNLNRLYLKIFFSFLFSNVFCSPLSVSGYFFFFFSFSMLSVCFCPVLTAFIRFCPFLSVSACLSPFLFVFMQFVCFCLFFFDWFWMFLLVFVNFCLFLSVSFTFFCFCQFFSPFLSVLLVSVSFCLLLSGLIFLISLSANVKGFSVSSVWDFLKHTWTTLKINI